MSVSKKRSSLSDKQIEKREQNALSFYMSPFVCALLLANKRLISVLTSSREMLYWAS